MTGAVWTPPATASLLAALSAAAAAALLVGPALAGGWTQGVDPDAPRRGPGARPDRRRRRAVLPASAVVATAALASSTVSGTDLGVAAVAAGAAWAVARAVVAARRAEEAGRRRCAVVDFCEALVGELRAGQPVHAALERSAAVWPEVGPVLAASRLDADLPAALRRLARSPGAEGLTHLAAAWQLCAVTGGGLAHAAGQVLESARADAAAARQVEGEVSSARATARLVAALPVVVLVAGQGLGARPWAFLLGHPVGVACLGGGVLLVSLGLAWIDRIAAAATSGEA
ncbi:MAG: hypothetical protein AVDCRST_MAG36-1219 [uncultured Nocardioidaceae bacterium]|uniref:Type II secretion system protein GspF domain-containing protein n=1 Tax=uncultured Nocardioidaceae bacterium TaxID=253824 RepID=A0A6J4LP83_9ACTN|nr:MAG: hypothetical protein AVDCRST_MAG36-1219 [uncultured Nocardioidaceae bacterium]